MNCKILLMIFLMLIVRYGYGQDDSNTAVNDSIKAIDNSIEAINDSIAKAPDTISTKELKKKRKRLIKYKKISSYNDTLVLINENIIVGEFKRMEKSVVSFKTKYSEKDFQIKWHRVKNIYSSRTFIISLNDGNRYTSSISSVKNKERRLNINSGTISFEEKLDDIVFMEPIGKNFLSNLVVDLDIGITLTKANNLKQLTSNLSAKYTAHKWRANGSFKTVLSRQDSISDINRMDGDIGITYFLPNDWYAQITAIYLSNDEQRLALRSTYRGGLGYFFLHSSKMYLGGMAGLAYTIEDYTDETDTRNSSEAYLGIGFNKYDIGDLSILSNLVVYPSLSENGRYRTDINFDMKYDLPLDFYIKMSLTYNYDNQPIDGASDTDYVFTTSFGWEFN